MTNLDEALERFHLADLEYSGGLASHGPMGAEALESLGHQALIPAFLDIYVPRLPPAEPGESIAEHARTDALGRIDRRADWVATWEARLAGGDWRAVVAAAVPELAPGIFASAGHGLLRTAHAIRLLEREDSELRRRELARGLAIWSARYQTLPGLPGSRSEAGLELETYMAKLPRVGEASAREGLFFEAVGRLETFPEFAHAIDAMPRPSPGAVDTFLGRLALVGAHLYCAHPEHRIAYVHAVTLPMALRGIVPLLDEDDRAMAALHGVQAVAALHSIFGSRDFSPEEKPTPASDDVARAAQSWDEIRYRAATSIQEHAIKMAEACWRADRSDPDPIFALAAADAAIQLEGARSAGGC